MADDVALDDGACIEKVVLNRHDRCAEKGPVYEEYTCKGNMADFHKVVKNIVKFPLSTILFLYIIIELKKRGPMPFGIYLHIPFCVRKCGYCDFYSVEDNGHMAPYLASLELEIDATFPEEAAPVEADSLYIGGGTPSLIPPEWLERLLQRLRSRDR